MNSFVSIDFRLLNGNKIRFFFVSSDHRSVLELTASEPHVFNFGKKIKNRNYDGADDDEFDGEYC